MNRRMPFRYCMMEAYVMLGDARSTVLEYLKLFSFLFFSFFFSSHYCYGRACCGVRDPGYWYHRIVPRGGFFTGLRGLFAHFSKGREGWEGMDHMVPVWVGVRVSGKMVWTVGYLHPRPP